jgi:hypothetical protein
MPGQAKDPTQGGKCVTCCGLLFFNTAEVGITGPKWREIKNRSNMQNAQYIERTQKKKKKNEELLGVSDPFIS